MRPVAVASLALLAGLVLIFYGLSPVPQGITADGPASIANSSVQIPPTATVHLTEEVFEPWTGDLDGMVQRRVIRVLTVYSPGHFYLEQGQPKGMNKEYARGLEKFINQRLPRKHPRVHVATIPVARNELIPALLSGRGDLVMAGLSITEERKQLLDFSIPVSKPINEILITGPSAPALESIDELAGKTVFVRHSSSYRESLEELNKVFFQADKKPVDIELIDESLEDEDLIEMVNSGLLPWAIVDDYKPRMWQDVFSNVQPRSDIVLRSGGLIAWAFRKESPELAATVNEFLKNNRQGTMIGNVLIKRYITDFDWAKNALSAEDFMRFEGLANLFRKYGDKFSIDYLLAAAQGYQESRLDQSARSGAGAVGVMQLLPSTARDPNINVADIHEVENNIHAGMKYLDFLRGRYFSDPDIDRLNQTLMALAAYNAGPSRMINLRNKAKKLGYDPNIWFDNVELVAATDVGQEPVRYVANIFKYYIAYLYSIKAMEQRNAAREEAGIK